MRKRIRLFIALGCASLAAVFLIIPVMLIKPEPTYMGRRLSDWVATYGRHHGWKDPNSTGNRAAEAIRQMGPQVLPFLLQWMDWTPGERGWRYQLNRAARFLPKGIRQSPAFLNRWSRIAFVPECEMYAHKAFVALGPLGAPAIPELTRLMHQNKSENIRERALFALAHIGPEALPGIATIMSNPDMAGKSWAMDCICEMGTNARPLAPLFIKYLEHTNWFAVSRSAAVLTWMKPDPSLAVPALAKGLNDPRYKVRRDVAVALNSFGTNALPALPALRKALGDTNSEVRLSATNAVLRIAPEAFRTLPAH